MDKTDISKIWPEERNNKAIEKVKEKKRKVGIKKAMEFYEPKVGFKIFIIMVKKIN